MPDAAVGLAAEWHAPGSDVGAGAGDADECAGLVDGLLDVLFGGLGWDVSGGDAPVEVAPCGVVAGLADDFGDAFDDDLAVGRVLVVDGEGDARVVADVVEPG